jgi:hypothetical protein
MIASIIMSRPSRKDNLANIVAPIPIKIGPSVAEKEEEKERENEGEYRGTNSVARTLRE